MKKISCNLSRVFMTAFIAILCTTAFSARAAVWTFSDGFDSNVAANWSCWQSEAGTLNQCIYYQGKHFTGMTNVYTLQGYSGWSDVGRAVSITPYIYSIFYPMQCAAAMTVMPHPYANPDFQLEVIDSATWTYVRTKRVKYDPASSSYPRSPVGITTPSWRPNAQDIFVRIGIIGAYTNGVLFVDGMKVTCSY